MSGNWSGTVEVCTCWSVCKHRLTVRPGGVAGHATKNEASHMQVTTQKKVDRPECHGGGKPQLWWAQPLVGAILITV